MREQHNEGGTSRSSPSPEWITCCIFQALLPALGRKGHGYDARALEKDERVTQAEMNFAEIGPRLC